MKFASFMRSVLVIICCCFSLSVSAQFTLRIVTADKDTSFLTREFSYRRSFSDTISRHLELREMITKLYSRGYLEATYHSFRKDSNDLVATLLIGQQWKWASLKNGNVDEVILNRVGFRERLYKNEPLHPEEINRLLENILEYCENNGYPFASLKLDSIYSNEGELNAGIYLQKNNLITIDSISITGDAKIAKSYLANYLGFRFPSVYREDLVERISSRVRELPFLSETHAPQVIFNGDRAFIKLFLQRKNASRFDFVLGVLPNSQTTGKLLINGEGQLSLANAFGRGENIFISFSQLTSRTTQADLRADYPYLFNLPFGIDGSFFLYKNDTLYLDVKEQLGIKYLFTGANYFKFFFHNSVSNILSFDSSQIIQTKELPVYLDSRAIFYGFEYKFERLDYRFNPHRGWNFLASVEAGNRKIRENTGIVQLNDPENPEFDFATLYDSIEASEAQYVFKAAIDKFWSLGSLGVIQTSYHGGWFMSDPIFQNELFRIGGLALLRGFDEQSVYVSQYHIATVEYHYLLGQNSFFYVFFDGGYTENESVSPHINDTPFGFGAGIDFETRAGIFALSYALGRQQGNPIEFRAAKIHFGYVNYF